MRLAHHFFFRHDAQLAPTYHKIAEVLDQSARGRAVAKGVERPMKQLLFGCAGCGDCALQHTGYICPESQCPKHTRNGPCGGSADGRCESRPDRKCVWVRAYERLASIEHTDELLQEITPPRMWNCNDVASWLNFHMHRDHQSIPEEVRDLFQDEEHEATEAITSADPPDDKA
jgi:methylenetetrahydrofolate reductase (NADPH)